MPTDRRRHVLFQRYATCPPPAAVDHWEMMPDPDHLVFVGAVGVVSGFLLFLYFLLRRFRRILRTDNHPPRGVFAGLRNLALIMFWTSFWGILLFAGAFLQSYRAFTHELPVAEIFVRTMENTGRGPMVFIRFATLSTEGHRYFLVRGNQWMLEGDILKWDNWLAFLGLRNRYRFTRLRGRYASIEAERRGPHTVLPLSSDKSGALWRFLYDTGARLPFVSTVYGNAVFRDGGGGKTYRIYVGLSGFVVREKAE